MLIGGGKKVTKQHVFLVTEVRSGPGSQDVLSGQDEDPEGERGAVEKQRQRSSQRLGSVHRSWTHG